MSNFIEVNMKNNLKFTCIFFTLNLLYICFLQLCCLCKWNFVEEGFPLDYFYIWLGSSWTNIELLIAIKTQLIFYYGHGIGDPSLKPRVSNSNVHFLTLGDLVGCWILGAVLKTVNEITERLLCFVATLVKNAGNEILNNLSFK